MSYPPICVLHIGKTGGSFLRSVLRFNRDRWARDLQLLFHGDTFASTRAQFGVDRQLAFVIREPAARFNSAFYSRKRCGRPTYNSPWGPKETVAFQWFGTAEALALALGSDDTEQREAAQFAIQSIQHLAKDYRWYLGNTAELLAEAERIVLCIDLDDLTDRLPEVMTKLGIAEFEMPPKPKYHAAPEPLPTLSAKAQANLRQYWAEEFELYEVAKGLLTL